MSMEYEIRVCQNPECQMRYPVLAGQPYRERCPRCRSGTFGIIREALEHETYRDGRRFTSPLYSALLDNIRSAWNVGSMFRSADGFGLKHMYLCGITPTPAEPGVRKTALGAEDHIPWSQHNNSIKVAEQLLQDGFRFWALEYTETAIPLDSAAERDISNPIILIAGNERCGVDPGLLELCERVIYIPMYGNKRSFNVAVAFGIAVHTLQFEFTRMGN